jgi:hypothetical protein
MSICQIIEENIYIMRILVCLLLSCQVFWMFNIFLIISANEGDMSCEFPRKDNPRYCMRIAVLWEVILLCEWLATFQRIIQSSSSLVKHSEQHCIQKEWNAYHHCFESCMALCRSPDHHGFEGILSHCHIHVKKKI